MLKLNGNELENDIKVGEINDNVGKRIRLHGVVYKIRKMRGFAFVILRTKRDMVQCVYSEEFSEFSLSDIKEESSVIIDAEVVKEERSRTGWELRLIGLSVLSKPVEELPIVIANKTVNTSLENLLDFRPITLRNEKERSVFKIQEGICTGFREFLLKNEFTEIHTPKIVFAGAEGGANIFRLNYFEEQAYLTQSPQFYKQMMVGVYERVFEIAPVFRAEKHDTSRHLNEYTSVDFEMGFIHDFYDVIRMEIKMLQFVMEYVKENYERELKCLNINIPNVNEFPIVTFKEAKERIGREFNREIKDYEDFEPEEEKLLYEWIQKQTGCDFVFVTHYPSIKRPFYAMDDPMNKEETLSFDLLFKGVEVTTGGQRIHDYHEQVKKMKERGMEMDSFESYLMSHKYGLPPHGGLGIGLERFTSRLLNQNNIRLSTLFPRDVGRLTP